jgi:two-component system cell cycle sensor histidine kinase/response regulator CckA
MANHLNILIVEDNPSDAELALRQIRKDGFEPKWERVETEEDFSARLKPDLDLILSDFEMPRFSGLRALELLKKSGLDIPFILMSGTIGEDTAVLAMKEGASDYLMKDRMTRLGPAINHALDESRLRRERRLAEEELRLFRTLVNQSSDSFEVVDPETGRFIDVNEKGHMSVGYTRSEFLKLRIFDIDPTVTHDGWPKLLAKLRSVGSSSGEGIHVRKDGTTFPVEFNVTIAKVGKEYVVAVVRDISERKEMEARFFRAQRLDSIGSMASGIAHDMNNILAPILMSAPMLRMGMSAENTERTLIAIEQSAQRGADLVKQLLTFGRGTDGARLVVNPGVLVHDMVKIVQETFPKNITVVEKVADDIWPILGDPTQLHQVLLNLCVNARDAMPRGGVLTIGIECAQFDKSLADMTPGAAPGPYVLIQVGDTGTGIAAEICDRIFDPFFTTKEIGKGTGLGLSTVVGIAKSHGGFVGLINTIGKGSVFQVFLPALPKGTIAVPDGIPLAALSGNGELIMVVDDEENIRDTIHDTLCSRGYKVVTAVDGAEATSLYALRGEEIRAVITDLDMPVMDGVMLIKVLRKLNPSVAVMVSSGVASKNQMATRSADLEALGVKIIIKKPYTAEVLLNAINELLIGAHGT